MSRRRWFPGMMAVVLGCVVGAGSGSATAAQPRPLAVADHGARSVDFAKGWKFALVNPAGITDPTGAFAGAQDPGFDDSGWRNVDVPHDWSIELKPTTADGTDGGTGYLPGGLGWYRKTFTLPESMSGKRLSLEFDGVYMDSQVYFNGELVGAHPYGYTGFAVDLTGAHTDGTTPNVVAVEVRNQLPSSRWYSGSGIYRNVHLVVTDPVHVARHGVFVTTPGLRDTVKSGFADVHVQTATAGDGPVAVVSRVKDADGTTVAQRGSNITAGATDTGDIRVQHPHLWSTDDPYLYTLETDLTAGGRVVDRVTTRFGIRWFGFDPDKGFSLNGRPTKLHGVDLHHDEGALGAAVNKDALLRQMRILKGMGVNAFRTSHNPPSPEMVEVCEELGIVMMVEAFDTWRTPKVRFDYGRFFDANSDSDIKEMVNAAKNSPAVVMWSIGNEIPDSTSVSVGVPIARRLIADVRSIDTTRPIVMGSDKYRSVPAAGSAQDQILGLLDGLGLNYNTAGSIDALHARYPDKFFFESESSSETSTRGVYQDPELLNTGENHTPGKRGTSSYDNNLASWTMSGEYNLKKDRDRPFFSGMFLWSGFDYIGEPTPYSVFPVKSSFFGAVDTAGFPKDAYYLYKSQWTTDPMVHLLPMNWTDHEPGEKVQVWAYSNADTVELFLNGKSLGARGFDRKQAADGRSYLETTEPTGDDKNVTSGPFPGSYTSPNGSAGKLHLTWTVPFQPGKLVAKAMRGGKVVATDEVDTAGPPAALRLTPDRQAIPADGESLSYVTAEVVDAHGVVVPSATDAINVEVTGNGRLAGLDNGRQESAESYQASSRDAWAGKALAIARSTGAAGPITVTARSPGLAPATTTVFASDQGGGKLIALEPVAVRTPVGSAPRLPETVRGVFGDGRTTPVPVTWDKVPSDATARSGSFQVAGHGRGLTVRATVTAFAVSGVDGYQAVVPVGVAPMLPGTAVVRFDDGVDQVARVDWDPVDPASYAAPGEFTVRGTVAGTRTQAHIRVTDQATRDHNLAADPDLKPSADASYSGRPGTLPAALIDGDTGGGGWSNFYNKDATALLPAVSKAHATDWISISWPAAQTLRSLRAFFTTDAARGLPSALKVTRWNGERYVPVTGLKIDWATASNQPTTVTFDPIDTTSIRVEMTSPAPGTSTGFLQVAELQAIGDLGG